MHTTRAYGPRLAAAAGSVAAALAHVAACTQPPLPQPDYNGAADSEKNLRHLFASNPKRLGWEKRAAGELQFTNSMPGEEGSSA